MTAEVIVLPNQNNTEMLRRDEPAPVSQEDGAYVLDLEQENLDLRNALASSALRRWRRRGGGGRKSVGVGLAVAVAFGIGWVLDPPFHLGLPQANATAQGRASVGRGAQSCTVEPGATEGRSAPRQPRGDAFSV